MERETHLLSLTGWLIFFLKTLCVMAICAPGDLSCSRKYHRGSFEYFCLCLYVLTGVWLRYKYRPQSEMGWV